MGEWVARGLSPGPSGQHSLAAGPVGGARASGGSELVTLKPHTWGSPRHSCWLRKSNTLVGLEQTLTLCQGVCCIEVPSPLHLI